MKKKVLALIMAGAMAVSLAACGAKQASNKGALMQGIYDKLTANEKFIEWKSSFNATSIDTKLDGDNIVINASGDEGLNGEYVFAHDGDYITATAADDDYSTYSIMMYLKDAIADYYGMNIEWVTADSAGLWGMLQTGDIDTIACLTTVNPDRLDLYWFTNTYAWESYSIVSRTEDGIPEDGDLTFWAGKTISTVASGNPQLILDQIVEEQAALGNEITPLFLDSSPLLVPAVVQHESDGSLMTTSTCAYTVEELGYSDTLHIQNIQWKNMPIVYGWARVEENKEIIQAFNALIEQMHEDGTLTGLSNKWFNMDVTGLPAGEVNYVTTTGENAWQSYE